MIKLNINDKLYSEEELNNMNIDFEDLDKKVFGFNNEEIADLDIKKIKIKYIADIENAKFKAEQLGGIKWAKTVSFETPIEVSINQKGEINIEDGHHRYYARLLLNKYYNTNTTIKANIELKGNPIIAFMEKQKKFYSKSKKEKILKH